MTFEIIQGDLFDPEHDFDALAQGVNTKGIMGAGIAVPFRERWPEMYSEYKELCDNFTDILPGMLHTYEHIPTGTVEFESNGVTLARFEDPEPVIFNLFSQDFPGRNGSYELLAKATLAMRLQAENLCLDRVGLPWIGCGIAGLERHNVQHLFHRILDPSEVEFVLVEQ